MTHDTRPTDDDVLRARLKSALAAAPPEALVEHVRRVAIHGASVHHAVAPLPAPQPGARRSVPATARDAGRPALRGWAEFLAPAAGAVLLSSLLAGAFGAFGSAELLARLFNAAEPLNRPGTTGGLEAVTAGPLVGFLLLALASAAVVALLADLSRGAPTLRRWLR
jgi:hypothetical protein